MLLRAGRCVLFSGFLLAGNTFAHGLSPMRLVVESGTKEVIYQFDAFNHYKESSVFDVECFKGKVGDPAECLSAPQAFFLPAKAGRKFKVRLETNGEDGIYFVCTTQRPKEENAAMVTRVCSKIGVGVSPTTENSKTSKNAK